MMDNPEGFNQSKRYALQKIAGLGATLVASDFLLARGAPARTANSAVAPPGALDIRAFGAKGDGLALDTLAVNRTIEAAARSGGGTVLFPAGTYRCFSIHLKSNVALQLDRGATILAAETGMDGGYDAAEPNPEAEHYEDYGHRHWHNALVWGVGLENVSVLGPGRLWGKGLTRGPGQEKPAVGDKAISLKNCHNVTIRDVSILAGGHFAILATGVDNFTVENVLIDTNRDGIDIDCCRNVRLTNMTVNSPWDDGICLKSSYALGYPRATENLTIVNCYVTGGYQLGTLLDGTFKQFAPDQRPYPIGRIKFGTESNGGFKNIAITNCVFERCRGLALESVDGALLEDVAISNITMRHIADLPIFMRLGSRMRGPAGREVGRLRRVSISNLVASHSAGRYCSILSGIPGHEIEDVRLSDIMILSEGDRFPRDAALKPLEKESAYPEPTMFGPMPAYGFYLRHVKGIEMSNVEVRTVKQDVRPAFILEDVEGADLLHVKVRPAAAGNTFKLENVKDFSLNLSRPFADTYFAEVAEKRL